MKKHFAYILTIIYPFIQQVLLFNHLFDYQGFTHIIVWSKQQKKHHNPTNSTILLNSE